MKLNILTGLVALAMSSGAAAAGHIDARSAGMAGVGIASGDYTRANLNPALLTRFQDNDDFYVKLAAGVHARDYQDAIDHVDDVQKQLDDFQHLVNNSIARQQFNQTELENAADNLTRSLKKLDDIKLNGDAGLDLAFYLPSNTLAAGLSIGTQIWANGNFEYDPNDEHLIENALATGQFNQNAIKSDGLVRSVAVTEIALSLATKLSIPVIGHLALGVTPKAQRMDSYAYTATMSNYENDDFFEDRYMSNETAFNLDIGLHGEVGPVQLGLVARNLIEHEIVNVAGEHLSLKPTMTAGASVQWLGMTLAADVDLIEDKSFVLENTKEIFMLPRQWARIGAEVDIFEQAQLRAGFKTDMTGNYENLFTVGLGLSPFDLLTLDLAGQFGRNDERGAALQLGFKF